MNKSDAEDFKQVLAMLSVTYEKQMTSAQLKLWWNIFKDINIKEFENAVSKHLSDPDQGLFMPKPAHIMRQLKGTDKQKEQSIEDAANIAWLAIESEIRRIGSYGSLKIEDRQALAAIKSLGGWKFICSQTAEQLVWLQKEFVATYQNFERTPVEALPEKLAGRIELINHKKSGLTELCQGLEKLKGGFDA